MNFEEPETMKELHRIREENYERTKHLSLYEAMKLLEREGKVAAKKYGIGAARKPRKKPAA